VSSYAYDALNRLTRIDYGSSVENVTYTYDSASGCSFGLGRLCSVVDESGGTAYAYDAFGNMLVQTHAELGITYNTFYTYDAGNRVTSITYPDGRLVRYERDVLGRTGTVTTTVNGLTQTIVSGRTYRADGLVLAQTFGNGLGRHASTTCKDGLPISRSGRPTPACTAMTPTATSRASRPCRMWPAMATTRSIA